MAANMDTVGTFEIALELHQHGLITCLHKHYSVEEVSQFVRDNEGVSPSFLPSVRAPLKSTWLRALPYAPSLPMNFNVLRSV
jgi:hypothetical protein